MPHALTKIWIHGIFGTKDRTQLILPKLEPLLYSHIKNKMEIDLDCKLRVINGTPDHIHLLFLLGQKYSLKDIMQNIKGETSHWINQNNYVSTKFSWQIGYGAFSVSESKIKEVESYINNQKEHHKKITLKDEYKLFMKKYGFNV